MPLGTQADPFGCGPVVPLYRSTIEVQLEGAVPPPSTTELPGWSTAPKKLFCTFQLLMVVPLKGCAWMFDVAQFHITTFWIVTSPPPWACKQSPSPPAEPFVAPGQAPLESWWSSSSW